MWWVALRILTGDQAKFIVIVFGVSFSTTMMAHQLSVLRGVMCRTVSQIQDIHPTGVWVMDPEVAYFDEVRPLPPGALYRVRGVPGVNWAVPLFKEMAYVRTEQGRYRQAILIGLDDASLVGGPAMIHGSVHDLKRPDAIVVDEAGYSYLWPGEAVRLGREVHLNDRRATLVGVCKASPPFLTVPLVYSRLSVASSCAGRDGRSASFVLVDVARGADERQVAERIRRQTGFQARPAESFSRQTMRFYLLNTGIPLNFAIVVSLGFIVGLAIAGQTFYLFTLANLCQFGALKAMGLTNRALVGMVTLQASLVGLLGYGIGLGGAAVVIAVSTNAPHLAGYDLTFPVAAVVAVLVVCIMLATAAASLLKVVVLEPAIVLRS